MTSFLCMAVPVQMFGLILIIAGWGKQSGFIIYTGGLMLIMSGSTVWYWGSVLIHDNCYKHNAKFPPGIFQLLAVGTSILFFDAELRRSPPDVYKFPSGVRESFGRSAYTAWVAAGCTFIAGVVCSVAPTLSPKPKTSSSMSQGNLTTDGQQYRYGTRGFLVQIPPGTNPQEKKNREHLGPCYK